MNREDEKILLEDELDEDDMEFIRQVFYDEVVPKLKRLDARLGTLNCEFAGQKYSHWTIHFASVGSEFDIIEFEYDEESDGIDLDL